MACYTSVPVRALIQVTQTRSDARHAVAAHSVMLSSTAIVDDGESLVEYLFVQIVTRGSMFVFSSSALVAVSQYHIIHYSQSQHRLNAKIRDSCKELVYCFWVTMRLDYDRKGHCSSIAYCLLPIACVRHLYRLESTVYSLVWLGDMWHDSWSVKVCDSVFLGR